MARSILLTGGTGYVGSYLGPRLGALGYDVSLFAGDINAPDLELPPTDVVIHLAGKLNSFGGAPEEIARTNTGGTINLARRCARGAHFVFLSTDQVFASDAGRIYTEQDAVGPETVYGVSKANAEAFLLETLPRVTVFRTAILYGYSHPRRRNTVEFIETKLKAGEPIDLYADVFACPTYVGDLAACVERAIADGIHGVHHACGAEYLNRCQLGEALCAARGYRTELIRPIARPASSNVPRHLHLRPSTCFADLLTTRLQTVLP